jgi:hypothetical protein
MNDFVSVVITIDEQDLSCIFVDSHQLRSNFILIIKAHFEVENFRKFNNLIINMITNLNEVDEVAIIIVDFRKLSFDDLKWSILIFEIVFFVNNIVRV